MDEYYLRRHWATALLYDLQHRLGMGWHEIQEATGRSRAQWLNVTTCKRPDTEYFIKRCEPPTFSKAGAQYEANQKKRGRPAIFRDPDVHTVSRSFIYDVCNNLKKKHTIKTSSSAWLGTKVSWSSTCQLKTLGRSRWRTSVFPMLTWKLSSWQTN